MEIVRNRETRKIFMSQSLYISDMLQRYGMMDCKPSRTPMSTDFSKSLTEQELEKIEDGTPHREAIGSLLYASISTRPDIATAVGILAQYVSNPKKQHWMGVKRVFRYLQGTKEYGLVLDGSQGVVLNGFVDSDWASDIDTRKSRTGYIFRLGNGTITWNTKKQTTVATSSTDAEYMAAYAGVAESLWICQLLEELQFIVPKQITLMEDNSECIATTENPVNSSRLKHIDIKYHFVREQVQKGVIKFIYCPSRDMIADIMTKPLNEELFKKHRTAMGIKTIDSIMQDRVLNGNDEICLNESNGDASVDDTMDKLRVDMEVNNGDTQSIVDDEIYYLNHYIR